MLNFAFSPQDQIVPEGVPAQTIAPTGALDDGSRQGAFHAGDPARYTPGWHHKMPVGVGDAPQFVYDTFTLIPFDIRGPGDNPATYLRSYLAPVWQNFAMRWQGMAVDGGNLLMTGLYTPEPYVSPGNSPFAGSGR